MRSRARGTSTYIVHITYETAHISPSSEITSVCISPFSLACVDDDTFVVTASRRSCPNGNAQSAKIEITDENGLDRESVRLNMTGECHRRLDCLCVLSAVQLQAPTPTSRHQHRKRLLLSPCSPESRDLDASLISPVRGKLASATPANECGCERGCMMVMM